MLRSLLPALGLCLVACSSEVSDPVVMPPERRVPESGLDYALEFDGEDDYATTGTAAFPFPLDPYTVSLWIKPRQMPGRRGLVTLRKDRDSGVELALEEGTFVAIRTYDGSAFATAPDPLPTDAWVHVAYSFDGTVNRIYQNAVLVAEGQLEPNDRTPTTGWLGTFDGARDRFGGAMDEVFVRDELLTEADLALEMEGQAVGDEALVVAHFTFDEGPGTRAYDRSARANDASLGDGIAEHAPTFVLSDR